MLNAGSVGAGDPAGTNEMPVQIHYLMDSQGYAMDPTPLSFPKPNTNSLRNLQFIVRQRYIPFAFPIKKPGWSLLNNSKFKYVGRNNDQTSVLSPYAALSLYEYDISYSFDF